MRIEIHGFHGPRQAQVVRMHAGLVGRVATSAHQLPDSADELMRQLQSRIDAVQRARTGSW
ncbi:hypothetical protein [Nocardia callitridis]|uniref:hypothetical protein n=1 Tax=Nocardia callitridis TaxID=648753 RepID=UPI0031F077AF